MKRIFSSEIKRIYARFPALMRLPVWEKIVGLVKEGQVNAAMEVAASASARSKQLIAQNTLARMQRVQRVKLFALQSSMIDDLRALLKARSEALELLVYRHADKSLRRGVPLLRKDVSSEVATLRRDLNKWLTDGIWSAVLLGVQNTETALVQIFKDNQESYAPAIGKERELMEERLSFGISAKLAGSGKPELARSSDAYSRATDSIYNQIVKDGTDGMRPSDRIWDMTKRSEADMTRIIQQAMADGADSREVANDLADYLNPDITSGVEGLGSGVYRNPGKNAMRLARTETNRAYVGAQAAWASSREWVAGMMVTLSPSHDPKGDEDECDDAAGEILSPEEFAQTVPFHPNCMCFGTIVIKDEYLDSVSTPAADTADEEEAVHGVA